MSRYELIKNIQIELERINRDIDLKIIKGISYRSDSRRHKFLTTRLAELMRPKPQRSFFSRAAHAVSMFVF